ncbi:hypothetical protein BDY21DRAFT_368322 [Lineolata rhizophorae]|uniref:Gfo/Idh/MocA-like oxidoreductase N-terminal domain-containing protein n=1 Tax=Lineolata rhizophorae TaxID=578093 RepID=A0A6A6PDZ1_9PEZI|nr:hypothetical protein BDY21DRAFT_368322 [Lineolata rhizophorae]
MINFSVIGTGWISDSFVQAAHKTKAWKLTAVYSRTGENAENFAEKYNVTNTYTELDSLGLDPEVQAVYIASPNSLHYSQAKLMLVAGKNVILEKPATSTVAEFEELFALAKQHRVFLLEANRHIHEVNFKVLQRNLSALGPIFGATLNYASYSSRFNNVLAGETPNVFSLKYSGGALVDLGVYPIAAAVALFGAPKGQIYRPVKLPNGADGGGVTLLDYGNFSVSITASKVFTSTGPSEVYGQNGTLIMNGVTDIDRVSFLNAKTKETVDWAQPKAPLNLLEEATEFARIIKGKDWDAATKLEQISRTTLAITTDLRRQNGIVFDCEKNGKK